MFPARIAAAKAGIALAACRGGADAPPPSPKPVPHDAAPPVDAPLRDLSLLFGPHGPGLGTAMTDVAFGASTKPWVVWPEDVHADTPWARRVDLAKRLDCSIRFAPDLAPGPLRQVQYVFHTGCDEALDYLRARWGTDFARANHHYWLDPATRMRGHYRQRARSDEGGTSACDIDIEPYATLDEWLAGLPRIGSSAAQLAKQHPDAERTRGKLVWYPPGIERGEEPTTAVATLAGDRVAGVTASTRIDPDLLVPLIARLDGIAGKPHDPGDGFEIHWRSSPPMALEAIAQRDEIVAVSLTIGR